MMFTVNNLDCLQANSAVHLMNTRAKHQLQRPIVNLSCILKGVSYSSIKIFNSPSPSVLKVKQEKPKFKVALRECLIAHTFCPLDKFLSTIQIAFPNINNFTYSY
jgi:hypothetical protein